MSDLTKRALACSLKKLVDEKPIDKITVKDIVTECGVNRHTFYYHFQDIYDLMDWLCQYEIDKILGAHKTFDTWKEGFFDLYRYLQTNRALLVNVYNSNYREHLENYIRSMMHSYIEEYLKAQSQGVELSQERFDFIVDTYTYGIVGFAMDWIANNMSDRYDNSINFFMTLLDGSMKYAISKMVED